MNHFQRWRSDRFCFQRLVVQTGRPPSCWVVLILKWLRVWDKTSWFPFSFHEKHNSQRESQALASFRTFAARPAYLARAGPSTPCPHSKSGKLPRKTFSIWCSFKNTHKSRARRKSYQKTQPKWLSLVFEAALVGFL